MYVASEADGVFRQGEIFSNILQYIYDPESEELSGEVHEYAVLATQDCDLQREFEARSTGGSVLNQLIFYPASPVPEGRKAANLNSNLWAPTKNNSNERYHVLQSVTQESDARSEGMPDLLIDFRNIFCLSYGQIYWQISSTELARRCVLQSPYREHFQSRAASYAARVPLDPPHTIA